MDPITTAAMTVPPGLAGDILKDGVMAVSFLCGLSGVADRRAVTPFPEDHCHRAFIAAFWRGTYPLLGKFLRKTVSGGRSEQRQLRNNGFNVVKRWATVIAICILVSTAGPARGQDGVLALLNINVSGVDAVQGTYWEDRAAHIGSWLSRHAATPDIIAIQQIDGWRFTPPTRTCGRPLPGQGMGDYDQIDILLKTLLDTTGVTYRVAYLTGKARAWGPTWLPQCQAYSAQALLYNPKRLTNLTAATPVANTQAHDAPTGGLPAVRRSLPLCNRGTNLMTLEALIDGPMQTDKCGRLTPSGPSWMAMQGGDEFHIAANFVRLAFVEAPNHVIDVFNVNPTSGHEDQDRPFIAALLAAVPPPQWEGRTRYYPPLMLGDFNGISIDDFTGFKALQGIEDMQTGMATEAAYPSQFHPQHVDDSIIPDLPSGTDCPGGPDIVISDVHCGLFMRIVHANPPHQLISASIAGPTAVTAGQSYRLTASASGGGLQALRYRWDPSGATGPVLDTTAGLAGTTQTWTLTVINPASGSQVQSTQSVSALRDKSACEADCRANNDSCMTPGPGSVRPVGCAAALRACLARC